MRHKWVKREGCRSTYLCSNCDAEKQSVPHPYAKRWVLTYYDRRGKAYEKSPPCIPKTENVEIESSQK